VLDDLIAGFRRLFYANRWETLVEDFSELPTASSVILGNLRAHVVASSRPMIRLASAGGRELRIDLVDGHSWPSTLRVHFEHAFSIQARPLKQVEEGPGVMRSHLVVGHVVLSGRPQHLLRIASPELVACLQRLIVKPMDELRDNLLVLTLPHPDLALDLVARLRDALAAADLVELGAHATVLPERFAQRSDDSWFRLCMRAIEAVGADDDSFLGLQRALMFAHPDRALEAAELHRHRARRTLHRALEEPEHRHVALRVLAQMRPDANTAKRLAPHIDVEIALVLLSRNDGFLAKEAMAALNLGVGDTPSRALVGRLVPKLPGTEPSLRLRLLTMLAPHIDLLERKKRAALARDVLTACSPDVALSLAPAICRSVEGSVDTYPRARAVQLLPMLPEHSSVDTLLAGLFKVRRHQNDVVFAATQRMLKGRSLALVPTFAALAATLPRPAADDLIVGIGGRRLDGAAPVLAGFLGHPDPEIVGMVAGPLGYLGGHDELKALGHRATAGDTSDELRDALRHAMDEIELRLGPVQRGGLSMVDDGGHLALSAEAGGLGIVDGGELSDE
jgi:hypothetical protein